MSHMVIFRTPEGKPGYQPADTVQDAIEVVERLRNDDGVENVRIFRLEELSFEYRPYYKVELSTFGASAAPEQPSAPTVFGSIDGGAPAEQPVDEPVDEPTVDEMAPSASAPIETSGNDVPPPPPAAPPWAAPPPPPTFGEPAAAEQAAPDQGQGVDDDDEFTGAGGPRRGLFGR